jgi:hypothetical protein
MLCRTLSIGRSPRSAAAQSERQSMGHAALCKNCSASRCPPLAVWLLVFAVKPAPSRCRSCSTATLPPAAAQSAMLAGGLIACCANSHCSLLMQPDLAAPSKISCDHGMPSICACANVASQLCLPALNCVLGNGGPATRCQLPSAEADLTRTGRCVLLCSWRRSSQNQRGIPEVQSDKHAKNGLFAESTYVCTAAATAYSQLPSQAIAALQRTQRLTPAGLELVLCHTVRSCNELSEQRPKLSLILRCVGAFGPHGESGGSSSEHTVTSAHLASVGDA